MCASFFACLLIIITPLLAEQLPAPRAINIWFDHWLWAWLLMVLALWLAAAFMWNDRGEKMRLSSAAQNKNRLGRGVAASSQSVSTLSNEWRKI